MTDTKKILRTEAGIPVRDNQNAQTAGQDGPVLLQDFHLIEKLARFNRERIPERIVHAVGSGAYGSFVVTNPEIARYTKMKVFAHAGKKTDVFARFSTVAASRGGPDTARDPRGFAVKFYTEDGNWDLVGNNTPIFFIRDGIKFPDFIHSQKYDPYTNRQEPNNVWDFFAHSPELTHQFIWLFGDRGIPKTLRHMDGFGSHTFVWVNAAGERSFVKLHFKTDQGNDFLTSEEAAVIGGRDPQHHQKDLYDAIARGEHPSWTLKAQIMPFADAATYRFNPFDLTKVWPHGDYPLVELGRMTLDRTPKNYFAEVEQAAFDPAHMVPGIGPSPDRMLQARLFAYGDAHRYRLGINHTLIPVNQAKGVADGVHNYGRDGAMQIGDNGAGEANYEPNSRGGAAETGEAYDTGYALAGDVGVHPRRLHAEDDDFVQARALYRLIPEDSKARLAANLAGSLAGVTLPGIVERALGHFRSVDPDLAARIEAGIRKGGA